MQYKKVNLNYGYIVRLEKGDKLVASLEKLMEKEKFDGGFFYGTGAVKNTKIGYRDDVKNEYVFSDIPETKELVSMQGSLAWKDDAPAVHVHASLADWDLNIRGGHVKEAEIAVTAEIFIHTMDAKMTRELDEETELHLLSF